MVADTEIMRARTRVEGHGSVQGLKDAKAFESAASAMAKSFAGAARNAMGLEGDFVEAACYQGFSARVVADAVGLAGTDRNYWLYDRFDVPEQGRLIHHCEDLHERVVARFADLANARIVKGSMPDSFAQGVPDRISFLHLDMNNAASEIAALEVLDDRMAPGGVIVLDDHGWATYRAQKDAEDDWFRARGKMVLEMPTGQGLVIR